MMHKHKPGQIDQNFKFSDEDLHKLIDAEADSQSELVDLDRARVQAYAAQEYMENALLLERAAKEAESEGKHNYARDLRRNEAQVRSIASQAIEEAGKQYDEDPTAAEEVYNHETDLSRQQALDERWAEHKIGSYPWGSPTKKK